ncbi:MAG: hypothetical protein AAGI54_14790 [Planctomycetota bacterium]
MASDETISARSVIPFQIESLFPSATTKLAEVINELKALNVTLKCNYCHECPVTIEIIERTVELDDVAGDELSRFRQSMYAYLQLTIKDAALTPAQFKPRDPDKKPYTTIFPSGAVHQLANLTQRICIALALSHPGVFQAREGIAYPIDSHDHTFARHQVEGFISSYELVVEDAQKYNWPPIQKLQIQQTWDWLIENQGFSNSYGEGALGRAIAAFSHTLSSGNTDEGTLDCIWAFVGLEAIYGRSNIATKSQILEKTELLLGVPSRDKKRLSRAYDFRSRFLHGDVDFPIRGSGLDAVRYVSDEHESFVIAAAVLLSTLQMLILTNRHHVKFEFTLQ